MVSRSRKALRRGQLASFQEELNAWLGAEVRVWYFSCSHDRFALRLARGEQGNRAFKFLVFIGCESIAVRNLGRLTQVSITDLRGKRWRMDATGISIDFYQCALSEPSAESLQEMAGIAPPILLDKNYSVLK